MGSLMAGWDSPVLDPDSVSSMRNRSFTKEEIANFWRLHKTSEDDDELESKVATTTHQSTYLPMLETSKGNPYPETGCDVELDKAKKMNDWWTRSSWAFLNEPPHEEVDESLHKYVAQFHVAEPASKKLMRAN